MTATVTTLSTKTPEFDPRLIMGPNLCFAGVPGTGKTYAISTLIAAGLEVAHLSTEPGGEESLLDALRAKNIPLDKLFLKYVPLANQSWETLITVADTVNRSSYEQLTEMKRGIEKENHNQFGLLVRTLADFTCDRTGRRLGPVDRWPNTRALVLDSLSGVNVMAKANMVGAKPALHQGEWGVSMETEEMLLHKLIASTRCWFILLAHIEKEPDEVAGRPILTLAALGRKLAPKLGRYFGDLVLTYKAEDQKTGQPLFLWSVATSGFDSKYRLFPPKSNLTQDFSPVVGAWLRRYGMTKDQWLAQSASAVA